MSIETITVQGLCVDVKYLVMGILSNNVYVICDDEGCMVVDPSGHVEEIIDALDGRKLDAIILTHAHWDHTDGASKLRELTGAKVIASNADAPFIEHPRDTGTSRIAEPCVVDVRVGNGDVVGVGNMKWKVIETPGHSPGSMCLFIIPQFGNDPEGCPVLISGDTLFEGTTGRCDFEGGSIAEMKASIKKLAMLPDDTVVLPGHNGLTTIGAERRRVFALFGDEDE